MESVNVRALFFLREKLGITEDIMIRYCWDICIMELIAFPKMNLIDATIFLKVAKYEWEKKKKNIIQDVSYALEVTFIPDEVSSENFEFWRETIMEFINRLNKAYESVSLIIAEGKDIESTLVE